MLVIGDEDGPDDIAGVMGGERTGVATALQICFWKLPYLILFRWPSQAGIKSAFRCTLSF